MKMQSKTKDKKLVNQLYFVLPSLSINESVSRAVTGAFCAQMNPTIEELADIKCSVSEAVTNCIVHAYRYAPGDIYITVSLYSNRSLRIVIRDKGVGIDDIKAARAPLFTTDTTGERSGMGFAVMESFMDKVKVLSHPGKGTKITLFKQLSDPSEAVKNQ